MYKKSIFTRAAALHGRVYYHYQDARGGDRYDATSRWPRAWSAYARPRYAICANVLIAVLSGEHGSGGSSSERAAASAYTCAYIAGRVCTYTRACPTRAGAYAAYSRVALGDFSHREIAIYDAMRFPALRS